MPRPRKCRRVCAMPENQGLEPLGGRENCCGSRIVMSIDEYEAIRLIDWEKLTQEQCAVQMGIARTTVTGIYECARTKLADVLVHGKVLKIQGGDYTLCSENRKECSRHCCKKEKEK